MMWSDFFLDANAAHDSFVHGTHHWGLVLLSVFVSIFSSTMALRTSQIARRAQRKRYYHIAIITGAFALGGGIWTTHFIGMLAFELPTRVEYSTSLTLFSLVPACVASWCALRLLVSPVVPGLHLLFSGALVGLGIGIMHYVGMAAMETPLDMRYEPIMFGVSIVVAVALAVLALWIRQGLRLTPLLRFSRHLVGGGVMGLAIASMHYTGMAAVRFIGEPGVPLNNLVLSPTYASVVLSFFTVTVSVLVVAVNGLIRSHELYHSLRAGTSRLRATLDTAVDGIITIDSQGLIQDFNLSAERLFGWTADEVMGRNIKMLMPEPYQSEHDGYLRNYLTSGVAKIIGAGREVVGLRKDGSHMPMRLAVGRVDLPGELLFVGFVTDISDRHALEASLRETAERAEQAAAAKSTFLANMSHEIRTPMNSIIGFTELLLQTELSATQRQHLNTVRQSSRSLLRLINDILDTTKMEKGRLELEFNDFSLKSLAMQVESSLSLSARAKGLDFSVQYPDDMPEYFRGDTLRLLQILTNLVGNAIKFTEAGRVELVFSYRDEQVHIQVRDTGIGMTPQQLELIFAPFSQADASISRRFGGTGLGTTIAHQLVDQMGGGIDVESALGAGSVFHVRLPLPRGVRKDAPVADVYRPPLPPLKVLIADDVSQNLELLALTLEREGHAVTKAWDGNEAVEYFCAGNFDVVLMDVHMPDLDGLQATRLIRQHERRERLAPTPVIALTASVMAEDRSAARRAGMDGFAVKPLDVPRLFDEIARVLDIAPAMVAGQTGETPIRSADIDWQRGVALWGDRRRLRGAIEQFLDSVSEKYPLPDQGAGMDGKQLLFSLHGIRGAAGNLALSAVADLAAEMEALLRADPGVDMSRCLSTLRALLEQARQSLAAETEDAAHASVSSVAPADARLGDLRQDMQDLLSVMRRSELDDTLLETVCLGLERNGLNAEVQALRSALDAFEFGAAADLLENLITECCSDVS